MTRRLNRASDRNLSVVVHLAMERNLTILTKVSIKDPIRIILSKILFRRTKIRPKLSGVQNSNAIKRSKKRPELVRPF